MHSDDAAPPAVPRHPPYHSNPLATLEPLGCRGSPVGLRRLMGVILGRNDASLADIQHTSGAGGWVGGWGGGLTA